jgi:nucleotide-binding universal stress UspA family protein
MYKRILVPTDGSECSEQGVRHAVKLASRIGATLHFLYVVEPLPAAAAGGLGPDGGIGLAYYADDYFKAARQAGTAALDAARRLARRANVRATGEVAGPANPSNTIIRTAQRRRADIIVMASHGRSGLQRFVLGSVTEGVMRLSSSPLLVVRCAPRRRTTKRRGAKGR